MVSFFENFAVNEKLTITAMVGDNNIAANFFLSREHEYDRKSKGQSQKERKRKKEGKSH